MIVKYVNIHNFLGRMIKLMADALVLPTGNTKGFAIDENTALVVTPTQGGHTGSVIGERGVLILDFSRAKVDKSGRFNKKKSSAIVS